MKQIIYSLCYTSAISLCALNSLQAETTEVLLSNSMKCTKEELMTFFPEQVVQSILVKAEIPKEEAGKIAQELSKKDKEMGKIVEEKAEKIEPNPFKDLSHRDLAIKIYRETLYEVFAQILKAHGISNEDKIQALLDEIQDAKSKLFIECIRKQQTDLPSPKDF